MFGRVLTTISAFGKMIYDYMSQFFYNIFFTPIKDLGNDMGLIELILEQLEIGQFTIFEIMVGPAIMTVVIITLFKWIKGVIK